MVQFSHPYMATGKIIALTIWTLLAKWYLCFLTLSKFVIAILPKSKHLLISQLQLRYHLHWFWSQKNEIWRCFHLTSSPSIYHEVMGPDAMILVFWMLRFKPAFSLASFNLNKKLFSYSSLSAIKVLSSAYLRLLIFLLAILIPTCDSSNPAFHMMYSGYKLNK